MLYNAMTNEEIMAEYNARYRPEITPYTNPELFDPLNPPHGWEYDAWHACWCRLATKSEADSDQFIVWTSFLVSVLMSLWIVFK